MRRTCAFLTAAVCLVAVEADAATQWRPLLGVSVQQRYDQDLQGLGGGAFTLVQPFAGVAADDHNTELRLRYGADLFGLDRQAMGTGEARVNHRLIGRQELELDRRTTLTLTQLGERVFEPTSLSRVGVLRSSGETTYLRGEAELSHRATRTLTAGIDYRGDLTLFEDAGRVDTGAGEVPLRDGQAHAVRGTALLALSPLDVVGLRHRVSFFGTAGGADATSHEPSALYERRFTPSLRLRLEGGPAFISPEGETFGATWHGLASLRFTGPRTGIGVFAQREIAGAAGLPGAVWAEFGGGNVDYRVTEAFTLGAAAGVYRNGLAPTGEAVVQGLAAELEARWDLSESWAFTTFYRRVFQEDRGGAADLSRNIFAAGLRWQLGRTE